MQCFKFSVCHILEVFVTNRIFHENDKEMQMNRWDHPAPVFIKSYQQKFTVSIRSTNYLKLDDLNFPEGAMCDIMLCSASDKSSKSTWLAAYGGRY